MATSKKKDRLLAAAAALRLAYSQYGTLLTVAREWVEGLVAHSDQLPVGSLPSELAAKLGDDALSVPKFRCVLSDQGRDLDIDAVKGLERQWKVLRASIDHAIESCQEIAASLGPTFSSPGDRQAEIVLSLRSLAAELPMPVLIPAHVAGGVPRVVEEYELLLQFDRESGIPEKLFEHADWLDAATGSRGVLAGNRKPRGRTPKHDPKDDEKLVVDWRASDVTKADFERIRGEKVGAVQRALDRIKARARSAKGRASRHVKP